MRTMLTIAAALAITGGNALAGALLVGEAVTMVAGQYIAAITFLVGVGLALARVVQGLYEKRIEDFKVQITRLQERNHSLETENTELRVTLNGLEDNVIELQRTIARLEGRVPDTLPIKPGDQK